MFNLVMGEIIGLYKDMLFPALFALIFAAVATYIQRKEKAHESTARVSYPVPEEENASNQARGVVRHLISINILRGQECISCQSRFFKSSDSFHFFIFKKRSDSIRFRCILISINSFIYWSL